MRKFLKTLHIKLTYERIMHSQDYTEKRWKQGLNIPHNNSKVQATKAARMDEWQTRHNGDYVDLVDLELTM